MKLSLGEQGITFLETMIALVIIGSLLIGLYGLLESGMAMYQANDAYLELMQQMRFAMLTLGKDIRRANSISFNVIKKELTINFSNGSKKYGLDRKDVYGPSGLSGQQLWGTTKNNPLASYISDFNIIQKDKLVTVILEAKVPKGKILTLQSNFTMRN